VKRKDFLILVGLSICVALGSWAARHFGLYARYWYTDIILHTSSGVAFGLVWLGFNKGERRWWMLMMGAASFAVLGSVAWEVWEFAGWRLMPGHMRFYIPELGDTLGDICCGFLGGILANSIRRFSY
jgi:hypothetical protein